MRKVCGTPVGFQSTLPRRERPRCVAARPCAAHFNPRSREGSDADNRPSLMRAMISIHAPAKGATADGCEKVCGVVFQSTLPRRERRRTGAKRCAAWISIHAPAKGATHSGIGAASIIAISIHAPAKGATCLNRGSSWSHRTFQSTLPRRERQSRGKFSLIGFKFQSTLPRRERPVAGSIITLP